MSSSKTLSSRRVALITGGSRGIGAAIATRLARDGFDIAITHSRSVEEAETLAKQLRNATCRVEVIQADSASEEALLKLVPTVLKKLGRLDVLVNNAGAYMPGILPECSLDDYDQQMAINVRAVFILSREAAKVMPEGGRIINIGSVNGDQMPLPGAAIYGATKAAVSAFTRGWARDLGPRKITVNCIQPGPVDTVFNPGNAAHSPTLANRTALGRYAKPEEMAALASLLAGPESDYITGSIINADGGFNA